MNTEKKAKHNMFISICIIAIAGLLVGLIPTSQFAIAEEAQVEPVVSTQSIVEKYEFPTPIYKQEGYSNIKDYWEDLQSKRSEYSGMAEEAIASLEDYLSDEQKSSLRELEADILNSTSISEIVGYETQFNDIVNIATEEMNSALVAQATTVSTSSYSSENNAVYYSNGSGLTRSKGVNYHNGVRETYYNLNMSGVIANAQAMGINGNYWVRDDGVKMYGDYVIVASGNGSKGDIISTSLGDGIILDYCPTAGTNDIATVW